LIDLLPPAGIEPATTP